MILNSVADPSDPTVLVPTHNRLNIAIKETVIVIIEPLIAG